MGGRRICYAGAVRRLAAAFVAGLAALCCAALPARALDGDAEALIARMTSADPGLHTYRADVAFEVGLHTFPYVRRTLHGNAYFKRPSNLELIFTDLPPIARAYSNLYVGLGSPAEWQRKYAIGSAQEVRDGRAMPYLVLTPLARDRRLREVDVFVDQEASLPARIVWLYRDGRIEMHQRFARLDGHDVVVAQNADIRLPAVHAFVNATITNYALNVDVDDAVFTKKKTS